MFGWINDCTECLVISKFGEETWHKIKETANCHVMDGGFLRYKYYPDSDTVELVVAASEVLGISVDDVLYAFGDYFIDYVKDNGYSNVLECLGSNLRDWLSNLNSLHDHLQASYPKGFVAPVFWSEDDLDSPSVYGGGGGNSSVVTSGSNHSQSNNSQSQGTTNNQPENANAILVHYYSKRGSLLVPLVTGLIKKVAKEYFDIDINMELLQLQDEEQDLQNTTWRVTTTNPYESFKLRGKKKRRTNNHRSLSNGGGDDDTVTTSATSAVNGGGATTGSAENFNETFREGGTQAANLRVEEFVMRSFYNEDCELFHALTLEQYLFLIEYWKTNKINDKWCYEIWSIQDDNKESWAKIEDLPYRLNPATIDDAHFGGMIPSTGKFPPEDEKGTLKSVPPKIRLQNKDSSEYVDLTLVKSSDIMLEDAIYNAPEVITAEHTKLKKFDTEKQHKIDNGELQLECIVWNDIEDVPYHTFTLSDLETTSTLQLFELVPKTYDPIRIMISCSEIIEIDDDEEDL